MNVIRKQAALLAAPPNLVDYDAACRDFSWSAARARLDGLPGGRGLNIAHEAVDRHAAGAQADKVALRWLGKDGSTSATTYAQLRAVTNRFANALAALGVQAGDHVFLLTGRIPALYFAVLGALKHRCIVTPLFSAFGPEPIATRMNLGAAKLLVTTTSLYRR